MISNARCIAHLDAGGLVLTADLRQARILRRLHDQARIAAGHDAWPTAQVLPLESWLASLWHASLAERDDLPPALPAVAVRWLWRPREHTPGAVRRRVMPTPGVISALPQRCCSRAGIPSGTRHDTHWALHCCQAMRMRSMTAAAKRSAKYQSE